jgi:hypothetical protein
MSHPLIMSNTSTKRLINALRLIEENPNGDSALQDLALALKAELKARAVFVGIQKKI